MYQQNESIVVPTIASRIADLLRDDIISRRIEPGTRITAKEIADKYGVSSMPVREAFSMLCGENLLYLNPYRGVTVVAVTPQMVAELNDLQTALESLLVELCMKKGYTEETLKELEEINLQMEMLKDDEQEWRSKRLDLNIRFHTVEYSPCKEHLAYSLFQRNLHQLAAIRKHYQLDMKRAKETVLEHNQIIHAIRNNDLTSAITFTKQHTLNSKRYALTETFDW